MFIGAIASGQWLVALKFLNATPFGEVDPVFERDASFYIFTLPFLDVVRYLILAVFVLSFIGSAAAYVMSGQLALTPEGLQVKPRPKKHLAALGAVFFLLLAAGAYLDMPRTLTTPAGIIHGAAYVDVVARIPILYGLVVVSLVGAGAAAYAALSATTWPVLAAVGGYLIIWIGGGGVSVLLQQLVVTPDEQQREAPYIARNIEATRRAFGLDAVEERQPSGDAALTLDDIMKNAETINNVRLWDHQPLLDTFGQIQEIRTYYQFASVDNDRYVVDGEYRQTMLSSRELNSESLPNRSWVNERLQYTHGFGVALGPVNQVTQEGLPVLFIRDLPPQSETDLLLSQPSIYFGELSNDYVVVNTNTDEFHYPQGDDNVQTRYDGTGGVQLGNIVRRLLFSLRLRSYELLVSGQVRAKSKVIFHRNISDRVETIAPFLQYDADPYLVISDGGLYWIRDAYTITGDYPYSMPAAGGINYIRNSVKVVIDAYNGTTTFYLAELDDPLAGAQGQIAGADLQTPALRFRKRLVQGARRGDGVVGGHAGERDGATIDPDARHPFLAAHDQVLGRTPHHDDHVAAALGGAEQQQVGALEARGDGDTIRGEVGDQRLHRPRGPRVRKGECRRRSPEGDGAGAPHRTTMVAIEYKSSGRATRPNRSRPHTASTRIANRPRSCSPLRRALKRAPNWAPITAPRMSRKASVTSTVLLLMACRMVTLAVTKKI